MSSPSIILAASESANGLASMLSELLRQNLEQKPARLPDFRALQCRVGISAPDIELALTMAFSRGALIIHNDLQPPFDILVIGDSESILDISRLPVRFGLPDFSSEVGLSLLKRMKSRQLVIRGMFRHFLSLVRLTRIMSVA